MAEQTGDRAGFGIKVKPAFEQRYKALLGAEYDEFIEYSSRYITKCIRVNTLKSSVPELKKRLSAEWRLKQVPWCKEGFWVTYKDSENMRYDIGNVPEHQLGYFYVQDAASMIPPVVLGPRPGESVLDICAAPGSKTSQIASYMENSGILVANDADGSRLAALGINLQRCGVTNALVTKMDGPRIKYNGSFDRVLVDAPCSGTGTIRRNYRISEMWSPQLVARMSVIQRKLVEKGFELLKPGGIMVYSTCTLEPEEDEAVVSGLLSRHPDAELLDIDIEIKRNDAVLEFDGEKYDARVSKCLRIYPQDNDSEGFFVAKIMKR